MKKCLNILALLVGLVFSKKKEGCFTNSTIDLKLGSSETHDFVVQDPNFGSVTRQYIITIPENWDRTNATALFFYMHGQGGSGITNTHYQTEGDKRNVITVYPQGMGDYKSWGRAYPGWNVPFTPGDTSICMEGTGAMCYDSCKQLGKCEQCSWTTCYDDLLFMKNLVFYLTSYLCIDDDKVFVAGTSNGGIFSYYLSQEMNSAFKGYVIESAQPLIGYQGSPKELKGSHLLTLNGRQDQVIPPAGGVDGYNEWIYDSIRNISEYWAEVQGCNLQSLEHITTPFDHEIWIPFTKGYDLKCYEYTEGCAARVVNCEFYGTHATYASFDAELAYWLWADDLGEKAPEQAGGDEKQVEPESVDDSASSSELKDTKFMQE